MLALDSFDFGQLYNSHPSGQVLKNGVFNK